MSIVRLLLISCCLAVFAVTTGAAISGCHRVGAEDENTVGLAGMVLSQAGACPLDRDSITFQTSRAEPQGEPQRVIIETVNFEDDTVLIRNVSDDVVAFRRAGNNPWRIGVGNGSSRSELPDDFSLPAGSRVRVHLRETGENDAENVYLGWDSSVADLQPSITDGSEVAILSPYG